MVYPPQMALAMGQMIQEIGLKPGVWKYYKADGTDAALIQIHSILDDEVEFSVYLNSREPLHYGNKPPELRKLSNLDAAGFYRLVSDERLCLVAEEGNKDGHSELHK